MQRHNHIILIAEDEETDQFLIQHAFRRIGVQGSIHTVSNGDEAVAYLSGEGQYADRSKFPFPSLLLTDLKMPVSDGFTILQALSKAPHRSVVPVIVLSSSRDPDDIYRAYQLGAQSYFTKPSTLPQLQSLLKQLYDYWCVCEVPALDSHGKPIPTGTLDKIGARFGTSAQRE